MKVRNKVVLAAAAFLTLAVAVCTNGHTEELKFKHLMSVGTRGTGPGQFKYIEDFDITADGNILATCAAHAYVQVFNKTTGEYVTRFGGKGDDDKHLDKPEGIAIAPNGDIFVADYNTGYVKVYNKHFHWMFTFSEYGSAPGENIKSEFMSIYQGLLYLPEAGNHRVSVFDLDGNFVSMWGEKGSGSGQLNNPEAAKVNSRGEVFVADLKNDRIQVFSTKGNLLWVWGTSGSEPGQLKKPAGVGIDKHDNVYVAEMGNNRVQVFTREGRHITMWGSKGSGDGQFGNLHGLIVDKKTGWVYVADTANNRYQVFVPTK